MKGLCVFVLLFVFSLSVWILPAMAADQNAETGQLKEELKELQKEIKDLEKRQDETEKKAREAEKKVLQAGYDKGFYIKTQDENFTLRTNIFIQFRYTYLSFDKKILSNNEDWSNFFLRRARVFFTGNAPNKDWTYFFHIQLEPTS
ncbi:MAG: hypothetical protein AB1478_11900, partial [Nitrospirota bacterium]